VIGFYRMGCEACRYPEVKVLCSLPGLFATLVSILVLLLCGRLWCSASPLEVEVQCLLFFMFYFKQTLISRLLLDTKKRCSLDKIKVTIVLELNKDGSLVCLKITRADCKTTNIRILQCCFSLFLDICRAASFH
jgi:hypothetical protein